MGRVVCESPEGRLNVSSVLLEGTLAHSQGAAIKLDLSGLPAFRIFPGQVRLFLHTFLPSPSFKSYIISAALAGLETKTRARVIHASGCVMEARASRCWACTA